MPKPAVRDRQACRVRRISLEGHSQPAVASPPREDWVAIEAPLIIRYAQAQQPRRFINLATLLRTPGQEEALVAGFLLNEGHIQQPGQILQLTYNQDEDAVNVIGQPRIESSPRRYLTHSGCGSCALDLLERLYSHLRPMARTRLSQQCIAGVASGLTNPSQLCQPLFMHTGGTHATLLFNQQGGLLGQAEDVGRHNALDKAIGMLWLKGQLDEVAIAWVSGRMGFELVQKCISANIAALIAVGAPTSLALQLAHHYRLAPYAFSRSGVLNYYPPGTPE